MLKEWKDGVAYVEVGISCVNRRFLATHIGINMGITQEIPTPEYALWWSTQEVTLQSLG